MKHHLALNIFLIAVAASNFNPVASQPYSALPDDLPTLKAAVNAYCSNGLNHTYYGSIGDWDVSQVTSVHNLFFGKGGCNPPIGNWDVSNVTNFYGMFYHARAFNQDISGWNVSSGTDFGRMFQNAQAFNQDISGWDVGSGTSFYATFSQATSFNQNIGGWNVSSGTDFRYMFHHATSFDQDIGGWDVSSGTQFNSMFDGATSFDQPSLYCKWQSNSHFSNLVDVCINGANCGGGQTTCPVTPAPVPVPATTPVPTTSAPTISLASRYFIALVENSTVATFNNSSSANEISFNLNITNRDLDGFNSESVTVLEYDSCSGETYPKSVVSAVPDISNKTIDGIYAEVPVLVDVNTTNMENISSVYPGYFNVSNETAVIKFCVMSELGESTIYNSTSNTSITTAISYSKVKVQVEIDMAKGFESVSVSVTEDDPEEEVAETTVDYQLDACECDDAGACINTTSSEAKTQNSIVNVCVYTPVENDVIIEEIRDMRIYSSTLQYNAISNSQANPITLTKSMDAGKKSLVTTRLVGTFFTDLAEGETNLVNIDGTAVMKFAVSSPGEPASRKLVRVRSEVSNDMISNENGKKEGNSRTLQDGLEMFEMDMLIGKEVGAASAGDAYNDGNASPLVLAVQSLVMGGIALLAVV